MRYGFTFCGFEVGVYVGRKKVAKKERKKEKIEVCGEHVGWKLRLYVRHRVGLASRW